MNKPTEIFLNFVREYPDTERDFRNIANDEGIGNAAYMLEEYYDFKISGHFYGLRASMLNWCREQINFEEIAKAIQKA